MRDDYIPDIIDRFEKEFLPEREYAASTLAEMNIKLNRYRSEFARHLSDIDVQTLSTWLDQLERSVYIKHRALWINIYRFAMSKGLVHFNAADATLPKRPLNRVRDGLTLDDYKATYAIADPWFQIAMDTALYTLQRRSDLVSIKLADIQDDCLPIIQQKTGMALRIKANEGLKHVIRRTTWSGVSSPFLIHKKPIRRRREYLDRKEHHTQVTPSMLSREFARLRDQVTETTATFHEIRSLGGRLLIEQGYSDEFVQVLMGHATMKMTEHYLADGKIDWIQAEAGLSLPKV